MKLFSVSRERHARMMDGLAVALLLLAIGIAGCVIVLVK